MLDYLLQFLVSAASGRDSIDRDQLEFPCAGCEERAGRGPGVTGSGLATLFSVVPVSGHGRRRHEPDAADRLISEFMSRRRGLPSTRLATKPLAFGLAVLAVAAIAGAQVTRGAISGTVRDQSGVVIPDATVTVVHVTTR